MFGGLIPSFSKHLWAALEKGDGKKFLGLAREYVRASYPTRNCSFLLNPGNCTHLGSISQLHQLKGCDVPWVLPLFLPPTLLLWALSLFSPMLVMSNFANFSCPLLLLHIQTVTSPFPLPHGNSILARSTVTISTVFWSPMGKMGSLQCQDTFSVHHYACQWWSHFVSICFSSGPKDLLTHYAKWGGFPAWKCIF